MIKEFTTNWKNVLKLRANIWRKKLEHKMYQLTDWLCRDREIIIFCILTLSTHQAEKSVVIPHECASNFFFHTPFEKLSSSWFLLYNFHVKLVFIHHAAPRYVFDDILSEICHPRFQCTLYIQNHSLLSHTINLCSLISRRHSAKKLMQTRKWQSPDIIEWILPNRSLFCFLNNEGVFLVAWLDFR